MSPAMTVGKISAVGSAVAEAAPVLADARRMAGAVRGPESLESPCPALAPDTVADAAASFLRVAADRVRAPGFWEPASGIVAADFLSFDP